MRTLSALGPTWAGPQPRWPTRAPRPGRRANAELLSSEATSADGTSADATSADGTSADASSSAEALSGQQKRLDAQRKAIQEEMDADRKLVAGGKTELAAKLSELQGELDMV